jgi:hypothetical protein
MEPRQPTLDEQAGMRWWNSLTEAERAQALEAAGWKSGDTSTPSAADAWDVHKKRTGLESSEEQGIPQDRGF